MPTSIAVIGGGFSGTLVAVHLLRQARDLRLVLIEHNGAPGRGLAYRPASDVPLLNVPAGGMSALEDDPDHFLRYAQQEEPTATGASFLPRRLYGAYLEDLLVDALRGAHPSVDFEVRTGAARDVTLDDRGAHVRLTGRDTLTVDAAVLATGHAPPTAPPPLAALDSEAYIHDVWQPGALVYVNPYRPVLLLGTSHTMLDALALLRAQGHQAPVYAVSRHGLLPQPHRPTRPPTLSPLTQALVRSLIDGTLTVTDVWQAFRTLHRQTGEDWRDLFSAMRAHTPALWVALPPDERARFLRHVRPYWEAHRHRVPPSVYDSVQAQQASGALHVLAGHLVGATPTAEGLQVQIQRRGYATVPPLALDVGAVINCTGPSTDLTAHPDPLIQRLLAHGLLRPDAHGLGLDVTDRYELVDRDGATVKGLYYVGPWLRARYWEATAIPELRRHAQRLAQHLLPRWNLAPRQPPHLVPA